MAIGDFASTTLDRTFRLVYLVFNTIENLTSQDEQVACFRNAAAHLEPGGRFVIEVETPQLQRLPPGETIRPFTVTPTHLGFDEFDIAQPGPPLAPLLGGGRAAQDAVDAVPLRLASRA